MGLDLSALKKMNPTAGDISSSMEDDSVISITETPVVVEVPTPAPTPIITDVTPAPSTLVSTGKISLSSLRGGVKPSSITSETPKIETPATPVFETKKEEVATTENSWKPEITETPVSVDAIVQEDPIETTLSLTEEEPKEVMLGVDDIAKEVSNEKQETLSIGAEPEEAVIAEVDTEKKVEFFPNLDIFDGLKFEDDIVGSTPTSEDAQGTILEITSTKEKEVATEESTPVIAETTEESQEPKEVAISEEIASPEMSEEKTETVVSENTPLEATTETPVTAEYVADVKQELSIERKIGGLARFKKIVVTVALTGVLAFGGLIGVGAILKHNKPLVKNNVLETTTPPVTPTPITPTTPESNPVLTGTGETGSGETSTGEILTESGETNTGEILTNSSITDTGATLTGTTDTGALTLTGEIAPSGTGETSTGEILTGTATIIPDSSYVAGVDYQIIPNMKKNIKRQK